jgi:hypothetical protein
VTIGAEISLSLRTADKGLAKQRHAAVLAQLDEHFDRLRAGPKPLSQKEQVAIAGILYRAFAESLEDNPGAPELWERVHEMNEYAISGGTHSLGIYNSEAERQAAALESRFAAYPFHPACTRCSAIRLRNRLGFSYAHGDDDTGDYARSGGGACRR